MNASLSTYNFESCPDILGEPHVYESFADIKDPVAREITELSHKHSTTVANFAPDRSRESIGLAINDMYSFIFDSTPHYRKYGFPSGLVCIEEELVPLFPRVVAYHYSGDYRAEFNAGQLNTIDRGLQWLDRVVEVARNASYVRIPTDKSQLLAYAPQESRELMPTRDALKDGIPLGYSFDHMLQHRVV